ncbi:hypothetical protein BMS3Abin07_02107 [bacterium BMS3Abin07]|nr:hypothetical protein BMS3Abin07_02107 [bacterium BMS3Abin07]GBE32552.1 hypothetical protein BMS3Bbin05_01468 [bacterium BMS3Bbin05]
MAGGFGGISRPGSRVNTPGHNYKFQTPDFQVESCHDRVHEEQTDSILYLSG